MSRTHEYLAPRMQEAMARNGDARMTERLNRVADDGWRLVSVVFDGHFTTAYFERAIGGAT